MSITFFLRDNTRQPFVTRVLEMEKTSRIIDIKTKIAEKFGIPKSLQFLTFSTTPLENDKDLLISHGITELSTIVLNAKSISSINNDETSYDTTNEETITRNFSEPLKMSEDTFEQFRSNLNTRLYSLKLLSVFPKTYSVINISDGTTVDIIINNDATWRRIKPIAFNPVEKLPVTVPVTEEQSSRHVINMEDFIMQEIMEEIMEEVD